MSIPVINRPRSALFEPHKCRDLKLGDAILKALAPSVTRTQYPCGMSGMQSQPEIDNRTGLLQAQPKAQMRTFGPREAECHKEQYRTHMSFQPGTGLSKRCKPEITRTHLTSAASHPRVQPRCPITRTNPRRSSLRFPECCVLRAVFVLCLCCVMKLRLVACGSRGDVACGCASP